MTAQIQGRKLSINLCNRYKEFVYDKSVAVWNVTPIQRSTNDAGFMTNAIR